MLQRSFALAFATIMFSAAAATNDVAEAAGRSHSKVIDSVSSKSIAADIFASVTGCGTVRINVIKYNGDPYGKGLTLISVSGGVKGLPSVVSASTVKYTALAPHGTDSFTYTISDGHGGSASGKVRITINEGICQ